MKNPHDPTEYTTVDGEPKEDSAVAPTENSDNAPTESDTGATPSAKKSDALSGAYYYVDVDERKLATASFARITLTIVAFMLQIVTLLMPAQAGAMYVSKNIGSYGLLYAFFVVFGMIGVSIWLLIMNQVRYKFAKRIPVEYAPKNGFKRRAYFGLELYMAVNAIMVVFELSFVCIEFDGWGLGGLFISLAALAASVAARQITHLTLKNAELIAAPDKTDSEG